MAPFDPVGGLPPRAAVASSGVLIAAGRQALVPLAPSVEGRARAPLSRAAEETSAERALTITLQVIVAP